MQTTRIIAAIVDTRELTLYRADGETIKIPQGDPRIRPLVQLVIPELKRLQALKQKPFIDLTHEQLNNEPTFENTQTHYAEAEKKMGGVAKFFRIAKSKLKELVSKVTGAEAEPVEPIELVGTVPPLVPNPAIIQPVAPIPVMEEEKEAEEDQQAPLTKSMDVVNEIIANAVPSHSPQFAEGAKDKEQTIVAVLEDGTVIPDMENLDLQLRHTAEKLGNPVGIIKFFERVSKVERGHSVKDLLKFMEKGELPIADDGSILVYKRLESTSVPGEFVDCHSRKVRQRVGSHVFMDEKLVDPNRSRDCSNGLHVARRDYLNSFSGNVTVLAKLAPEDVIAVPHSDARKLRAKGYFIIAQLSAEDAHNVCSNKKLTDTNLLGNAVAGNHTPIIETVQITEQRGGGLIITPVNGAAKFVSDAALSAAPLRTEEDLMEENSSVDARELGRQPVHLHEDMPAVPLSETVGEAPAKYEAKAPVQGLSKVQQLVKDFEDANTPETKLATAVALVGHKKSVKKSWTALGVPVKVADDASSRANAPVTAAEAVKTVKASSKKPAEKAKPSAGTKGKTKTESNAKVVKAAVKKEVKSDGKVAVTAKAAKGVDLRDVIGKPAAKSPMAKAAQSLPKGKPKNDDKMIKQTLPEKASQLMYNVIDGKPGAAKELLLLKKTSKKSWDYLGVTESQLKQVKEAAGE